MSLLTKPPVTQYARPGANPTLETIEYVKAVLQKSEVPVSRNFILAVLSRWEHSTTRQTLNVVLEFLSDQGVVAEGSKGLVWVTEASPELLEAIHMGPRL